MTSEEAVKIIEKEINNIYGSDGSTLQVNEIAIVTLLGRPNGGWIPIRNSQSVRCCDRNNGTTNNQRRS